MEGEEEGNKTSEMFPITEVEEDSSCAWLDLRNRPVYIPGLCFLASSGLSREKGGGKDGQSRRNKTEQFLLFLNKKNLGYKGERQVDGEARRLRSLRRLRLRGELVDRSARLIFCRRKRLQTDLIIL